jgi:hypothetical protein
MKRLVLFSTLVFLLAAIPAAAVQINATWDSNMDGLTDGYYLSCNGKQIAAIAYPGTSWNGDVALVNGNNTFILTAFRNVPDVGEILSDPSDPFVLSYTPPTPPPPPPPPPCTTRRCQCEGKKGWTWFICYYWGVR